MYQNKIAAGWTGFVLLASLAIGKAVSQPVDPGVRAVFLSNFQEQISVQQSAIVAQLGGPNQALGNGLGIFASLTVLNQLRSFESIFSTATDLSTLIGQFTLFEQQAFELAAAIFCRNSVAGCAICAPGFTICNSCLPSFILGPGGTTCLPGPTPPQLPLPPFTAPVPGGYGGPIATPQAALILAQQQSQLQASQQTSIAASFPVG